MVRGVQKQIVVIRDTGSDMFEQAILIVNPKTKNQDENDMTTEAKIILDRYINRYYLQHPEPNIRFAGKKRSNLRFLGWTSIISTAAVLIYMLFTKLF